MQNIAEIINAGDTRRYIPAVTPAQMRMVLEVSRLLAVPAELDVLLSRVAGICSELLDCEVTSIFLHDKATNELWSKVVTNSVEIRVPSSAGIVGQCFTTNLLVHVPVPYEDRRFNSEPDRRNGFVTRSLLACPLPDIDGKPLGVIEAINKRVRAFNENDFGLIHLLGEQSAVAIQRHAFQHDALRACALQHEMDLARQVQQSLIPRTAPKVDGFTFAGWTLPASTTGGDCFDYWKTADGRIGVLLADASGHGLAPALIVSQARTLIRALAAIETDPHRLLARANDRFADDLKDESFITAFLGFISSDGTLNWSSAGQGPVFVRQSPDGPLVELQPPSTPLGVHWNWSDAGPPPVKLNPGGSLLLASDGIFEQANADEELFGVPRMLAMFDDHRKAAPDLLLTSLRRAVADWHAGHEAADDQTIVIIQRDLANC